MNGFIPSPMLAGLFRLRQVAGLCPLAELDQDFIDGQKKLIPMIFIHGFNANAEEHYHVPMILAAHGFLCLSMTMMDGSAPHCTDKDGKDVWFDESFNQIPFVVNGQENPEKNKAITTKLAQRVIEQNALGEEIASDSLFKDKLGFPSTVVFDIDKMFIGGQSFGGCSAMESCRGNQSLWKMCLSLDMFFVPQA